MSTRVTYDLLDTAATSKRLGISAETLKGWRSHGKGPRYIKFPNYKVRYRTDWLDQWVEECSVDPEKRTLSNDGSK